MKLPDYTDIRFDSNKFRNTAPVRDSGAVKF